MKAQLQILSMLVFILNESRDKQVILGTSWLLFCICIIQRCCYHHFNSLLNNKNTCPCFLTQVDGLSKLTSRVVSPSSLMYCHISVYKHCIDSQVDGNLVLILMFGKSHVSPIVSENKNMRVKLKKEMWDQWSSLVRLFINLELFSGYSACKVCREWRILRPQTAVMGINRSD